MPITPVHSGKVRELYAVGDDKLLMVASDRISAFDVILPEPIPDKGRVLTAMTVHWLEVLSDIAPSHLVTADPADMPATGGARCPGLGHCGPGDARAPSGHAPARVHRAGLPGGFGVEGVRAQRRLSTARLSRRGCARPSGSKSRCSRRRRRPKRVTT